MLFLELLFSFIILYLVFKIIFEKNNPLNSLLRMILLFIIYGLILIENHLEYFGFILIIVYVGAIAIMFLFVVFILNSELDILTKNNIKKKNFLSKKFIYFFCICCLLFTFFLLIKANIIQLYMESIYNYVSYLNFSEIYNKNILFTNFYHFLLVLFDTEYATIPSLIDRHNFEFFFKYKNNYNIVCFPIETIGHYLFINNYFILFFLSWLMFLIPLLIIVSCKLFFDYKKILDVKIQKILNQNEIIPLVIFK